ncbi:hypothetical protein [Williamsia sp. DF01-3]|uniref:hypothetical protein n=1 Tax=Williamsia sp. DF01-3 TaxID=2934157 RepID=UPI001FF25FE5|nr:hypothetical protein [Williamsia sp. DF01-3]MCK0517881.1 hypothetical protein [Williamsia sp. DF01-3]
MASTRTKTTTQKGLGYDHQRQAARLKRTHVDGTPCWWCNKPMYLEAERNWDREVLAADHTHTRATGGTKADRLLHGRCNKQRGDGSRDHLRPAITGESPTETAKTPAGRLVGHTAMNWPWPTT